MVRAASAPHPRLGVVKLASCDGCQLTLLNLEDALLSLAERVDIVEFPEATSHRSSGPYDVVLVEGSVSTEEQLEQIHEVRRETKLLVTIGACATAGGIQALRNWGDHDLYRSTVYAHPEYIDSLATAQPVADYVKVDGELRGCPINAGQLLEFLTALLTGRRPDLPDEAVCAACKRAGRVCVMVAQGIPCLGPVTMTGCGSLCPGFERGCYGCFGPREQANVQSLARQFEQMGRTPAETGRLFAGFTGYAIPFRDVVTELGGVPGSVPGAAPLGVSEAHETSHPGGR
jgi:coenzyme F420-reducing hydrogenase gamma subunit